MSERSYLKARIIDMAREVGEKVLDAAEVGALRAELAEAKAAGQRQYDENVNRIAAEGAAELRAEKAEARIAELEELLSERDGALKEVSVSLAEAAEYERVNDRRHRSEIIADLVAANKKVADLEAKLAEARAAADEWKRRAFSLPDADWETKLAAAEAKADKAWAAENFPNATEADGVCVGENTPGSMAIMAAQKIENLKALHANQGATIQELQKQVETLKKSGAADFRAAVERACDERMAEDKKTIREQVRQIADMTRKEIRIKALEVDLENVLKANSAYRERARTAERAVEDAKTSIANSRVEIAEARSLTTQATTRIKALEDRLAKEVRGRLEDRKADLLARAAAAELKSREAVLAKIDDPHARAVVNTIGDALQALYRKQREADAPRPLHVSEPDDELVNAIGLLFGDAMVSARRGADIVPSDYAKGVIEMVRKHDALDKSAPTTTTIVIGDPGRPGPEEPHVIWSNEHHAYWREGGHGYTAKIESAGTFTREDAIARTKHCGPEKGIVILSLAEAVNLRGPRQPHELTGFLALWADQFARERGLNGLHPVHYDLLLKYGARMDGFKRATEPAGAILRGWEKVRA